MATTLFDRRMAGELKALNKDRLNFADAFPSEEDKKIWYLLIKGAEGTDYENGYYLGKIILPAEYPTKPPDFQMLTPNGRFDINQSICLTNSRFHPESHSASWNISNCLLGMASIMADDTTNGVSHRHDSPELRRQYRDASFEFNMKNYKDIFEHPRFARLLPGYVPPDEPEEEKKDGEQPVRRRRRRRKGT